MAIQRGEVQEESKENKGRNRTPAKALVQIIARWLCVCVCAQVWDRDRDRQSTDLWVVPRII